ncbi:glutaredoxin family protein [Iodobacter ciconiae]|uniref:Glutaredoxin family protein n=1 Tax=Iodobacter ciconiae TaxID=2496266 RepID=A0A3S8ZPR6_9NEIS|nr:glutaredoxin family protein [Iodobacter ciconiae]AZN35466.1 glutaredoxin family protein [Iodobacter ciconiae]
MKNLIGLTLVILLASHIAWKQWGRDSASSDLTTTQIQQLAASVKAEEVVMYSTTECPHCREAKGWLAQNGFAFTECNMSNDPRCEVEFKTYGADGTPFLVIRRGGKERHMKDGFDSDEFLAALRG